MKPKILIIGKQNHLGWIEHSIEGFLQAGCSVEHFFINKLTLKNTILKGFYKKFHHENGELKLQIQELSDKIKIFNPTLVVFVGAFFVPYELFALCKEKNIITAAWVGDLFGEDKKKYIPFVDKLYVSDSAFISIAQIMGFKEVHLLQFGYNPNLHVDLSLSRRNAINFIGSYTNERDVTFQALKSCHFEIYGSHWEKLSQIDTHWQIENKKIDQKKVAHIYNTTLATLNVAQKSNIINMVNMRTFEAIACGSCMINDNVKDLEFCFERDKEILVYNSFEELEELTCKVLQDSTYAKQIAQNGYQRILGSQYSYKDRALSILKDFNIRI